MKLSMKKIIIICLLLMLAGIVQSDAREKRHLIKGNYYYNHGDYFEAIPHLEKVAAKSGNVTIYSKLGDCYNITNDREKAVKAYARAVAIRSCKKEILLRYAQLLMQMEQYEEAKKWLTEYDKKGRKDSRTEVLFESCRTAKELSGRIPGGLATLLPFNTNGSEFAPTRWRELVVFAADAGTALYKATDPSSGRSFYDLYFARCDKQGNCSDAMDRFVSVGKMEIANHNAPCTFSADGKTMYYTRSAYNNKRVNRGPAPRADSLVTLETMIVTYDSVKNIFNKEKRFEHNDRDYAMAHAAVSPNGNTMALVSDMPKGKGRSDIYICKKTADGKWSKPVNAGEDINTAGDELFPSWADDNTLSFSSDGLTGLGGLDIYTCKWDEKTSSFSTPVNIGIPINSTYDDISLAIKTGEDNTWFSSNRPAAKGGDNIYFYRKMEVYLRLTVVDSETRKPLAGVTVAATSRHRKMDTTTDNNGQYFSRLYPGDTYTIDVVSEDYPPVKTGIQAMTQLAIDTLSATVTLTKRKLAKDTVLRLVTTASEMRNKNVMDSPGVRDFTLNQTYEVGDFQYDYGKYALNASHQPFLDTMLAQLNRHPTMRIQVQARTDCRGSVASNKALSDKRALSVVDYFVKHGIPRERLEYLGLGNTRPKAPCPDCSTCTEKEHSLNRILEFKVLQL
jgi:outer membrane protein OmpA-like peptidoglycan-associated protein/tetratricopeptide (TPR) repeat protein